MNTNVIPTRPSAPKPTLNNGHAWSKPKWKRKQIIFY